MKRIFFTLTLLFITILASAQNFVVPSNYSLKTEAELSKYEQDVINCADWLMKTSLNVDKIKRVKATKFLNDYIQASPAIKVVVKLKVTPFLKKL